MEDYRLNTELERILDQAFHSAPTHYFDDFPVWKPGINGTTHWEIDRDENSKALKGCSAYRDVTIKTLSGIPIQATLVGGVAVDTNFQGSGIGKHLISKVIRDAKTRNREAIILWSGSFDFYQPFGFQRVGTQCRIAISDIPGIKQISIPDVQLGWNPKWFELIKNMPGRINLSSSDRSWFESHKNTEWISVGNPEAPRAFAAIGRGIDLNGIVHEWHGEPLAIFGLLRWILERIPEAQLMGHPKLFQDLGISSAPIQEAVCLALILKPESQDWEKLWKELWFWGLDAA